MLHCAGVDAATMVVRQGEHWVGVVRVGKEVFVAGEPSLMSSVTQPDSDF